MKKSKIKYLMLLTVLLNFVPALENNKANAVTTINNFTIDKYLGKWYEIARLPNYFEKKCNFPITAQYAKQEDGKISVTNTCIKRNGDTSISVGIAVFAQEENIGKLKVTFAPSFLSWMSFAYGDYWVIDTDYNHYSLVGDPSRQYLWILSRTTTLKEETINHLKAKALSMGYDLNDLIYSAK
jgi:apolipoprotein D and lipocalin family protein